MSQTPSLTPQNRYLSLLSNPKINLYTPDYIVQLLTKQSLLKLQQFMQKSKHLKLTNFLRFFRQLLPFQHNQNNQDNLQFYLCYALFKLFTQICNNKKKVEITFSDISAYIAQKMPNFVQQNIIQEKMLPFGLNIDEEYKKSIVAPRIFGQIDQDHYFLTKRPIRSDRIQHKSRQVGQSEYSKKFKLYFSIDKPSTIITIYDNNFNEVNRLQTQQDITKRDMVVNYIAWSDWEQKIACLLGNYSISMWSKDDNYKYEVNVPLPAQYLANPYVIIRYMDSMRKWITIDNRPAFYVLNNKNYQPETVYINNKIKKMKQSEKFYIVELHYVQLLCIGFQRNLFLISLKNKQIISQLHNFKTSLTSLTFSQSYQTLFVSTYQHYFKSYQLSQFQDLLQKSTFQGHKSQISLLGTIQKKPIVFSLQQNSILKMFDIRNSVCYQSLSVLKNIIYKQVLYLGGDDGEGEEAICLIGSKMHVYGLERQVMYKEVERIVYIGAMFKDLVVVTNKNIYIYNIRNGSLKSVIKPSFTSTSSSPSKNPSLSQKQKDIFSISVFAKKQKLFITNQQGQCQIFDIKQMQQIQKWSLNPKTLSLTYDQQNQLIVEISLGNLYISQYHNEFVLKQLRRQIINNYDIIRFYKISVKNDIVVLQYQNDDCLYFYAYEKSKVLGYLYLGEHRVLKFKNVYKKPKTIYKVIDLQFYENTNLIFLLLDDRLLVLTYKRSLSSMSFMIKKQIKLWENPLQLANNPNPYIHNLQQAQIPLHSTSLSLFESTLLITSNLTTIISSVSISNIKQIPNLETYVINKDNYNPNRIGNEMHLGQKDLKHPMVMIRDEIKSGVEFEVKNYMYKIKLGEVVSWAKIGNLLAVGDQKLNIILWQCEDMSIVAGVLNCAQSLPKQWDIFKYSQQQIKQVQFVLDFLQNQQKFPSQTTIKNLSQKNIRTTTTTSPQLSKITITQLIKQDKKNGGLKTYRSCSLREKKIIMQKQRDDKQKLQNYLQQQKIQLKQKPSNSLKNNAQKQINDTLGYLSLNHNQTILKKGIIEEDIPEVRALERKLMDSINKSDKKSLVSYKTGDQSFKSLSKLVPIVSAFSLNQLKFTKTLSTEVYEGLTEKLGLKKYNSKQLITRLNSQKNLSQRSNKMKSLSKQSIDKLPKIQKI